MFEPCSPPIVANIHLPADTTRKPAPRLPPDAVDSILDFLDYDRKAFQKYCLVSKSWVYPTRRRLFNRVTFDSYEDLKKWKGCRYSADSPSPCINDIRFPNAREFLARLDNDYIGWVHQSFANVVRLELSFKPTRGYIGEGVLTRLSNFLPTIKSLSIYWNHLSFHDFFNFISSFRLLEDLHVAGPGNLYRGKEISESLRLPKLNGTLVLELARPDFVDKWLKLQDTFQFRKVVWKEKKNDFKSFGKVKDLVSGCSETLEHIDIDSRMSSESQ